MSLERITRDTVSEIRQSILCSSYSFFFFNFYLFIYLWLCWVFVSVRGLSLVAASGGHSSSRCTGLSLSRPLLLQSTGSRRAGSVIVAHGPSRSAACGIFPDQGSNPRPPHWQADPQPLRHQGSPSSYSLIASNRNWCYLIQTEEKQKEEGGKVPAPTNTYDIHFEVWVVFSFPHSWTE